MGDGDHIYEKIEVANNDTNNNDKEKKERKEKKKKKKEKLKVKTEKLPKKKKKEVDVQQAIYDEKSDEQIVVDTPIIEAELPSFRGAKATNVSKINEVEEPIQESKPDPEP